MIGHDDILAWFDAEGIAHRAIDADGHDWIDEVTIADGALLVAQPEGAPYWVLQSRFEVRFGDVALSEDDQAHLHLVLRSVFLQHPPEADVRPTDGGVQLRLMRRVYPDALDRQVFMDAVRGVRRGGHILQAEVDRYLALLARH